MQLIRAIVTLYLVTSLLHTVHSKVRSIVLDPLRRRRIGIFFGMLFIMGMAGLDIAIVNDLVVISSHDNMQALAFNDVYTSSSNASKMKSKEF